MKRKVYPDRREIQRKTQAVTGVLNSLAELGISVNHIDMNAQEPCIKIDHCPGSDALPNCLTGRGEDELGKFQSRVAYAGGCRIEWREQQ